MMENSNDRIPKEWSGGQEPYSRNLSYLTNMESLPKLDTSTSNPQYSARNSYASSVGSNSARNSYASMSEVSIASSRSSISSLPDSLNRVSSFSRTSYEFSPDSALSSPATSRESSPNPISRYVLG
jgi:hypothetical protein